MSAKRSDMVTVEVNAPDRGLVSRFPTNVSAKNQKNSIVLGSNIRAEDKMLRNSPGVERVSGSGDLLDSPITRIYQANILNQNLETSTAPLIGTGGKVFSILRRAEPLVCPIASRRCKVKIAFVGETGVLSTASVSDQPVYKVAAAVAGWSPDYVVLLGDSWIGGTAVDSNFESPYETLVAQFYGQYVEGYSGKYGQGSDNQRLFPALGENDSPVLWEDFFRLPAGERYYSVKLGPVELFVIDATAEPSSLAAQQTWLEAGLGASDAEWPIVVVYYPPYSSVSSHSAVQWDFEGWGAKAVVSSHSTVYERLQLSGGTIPYYVSGLGGDPTIDSFGPPSSDSKFRYSASHGALLVEADYSVFSSFFRPVSGDDLDVVSFSTPRAGSGICYLPDTPSTRSTVTKLVVEPPSAQIEVGESWNFSAIAYYPDGTWEDVTKKADWVVGTPLSASVSAGVAYGSAVGSSAISASFLGASDSSDLTVVAACTPPERDIVLVAGVSSSMGDSSGDREKFDYLLDFSHELSVRLHSTDRVALVTYADTANVRLEFTTDFAQLETRLAIEAPAGGRKIADGMEAAWGLLQNARPGVERHVFLIVDGETDNTVAETDAAMGKFKLVENLGDSLPTVSVVAYNHNAYSDKAKADAAAWGTFSPYEVDYHSFVTTAPLLLNLSCRVTETTGGSRTILGTYFWDYDWTLTPGSLLPPVMAERLGYMWSALRYEMANQPPAIVPRQLAWVEAPSSNYVFASVKAEKEDPYAFNYYEESPDNTDYLPVIDGGCLQTVAHGVVGLQCSDGFPTPTGRPGLDFGGFLYWDVIDGSVDLCGTSALGEGLFEAFPGQSRGMYVDLCGSGGGNRFEGTMRTKTAFTFQAGHRYRLRIKFAGPNRSLAKTPGLSVSVSAGTLLGARVEFNTVESLTSPMTEYSWEFTTATTVEQKVMVRMNQLPAGAPSSMGIWMDDVVLEDITDAETPSTIFSDDFNSENPF